MIKMSNMENVNQLMVSLFHPMLHILLKIKKTQSVPLKNQPIKKELNMTVGNQKNVTITVNNVKKPPQTVLNVIIQLIKS